MEFRVLEFTAAGTVSDFHRIPFYRNFEDYKVPIPDFGANISHLFGTLKLKFDCVVNLIKVLACLCYFLRSFRHSICKCGK